MKGNGEMNVTRHEKVNRMAEAGHNLCGNAFFSNAERMMAALETKGCNEIAIVFKATIKAMNKDDDGVGKIELDSATFEISQTNKYKDSFDDVVLDFVNPDLPGINPDDEKSGKTEIKVNGLVMPPSRMLTTAVIIYRDTKKNKTYFAGQGLGDDAFMTFKGLPTDTARHRYVNKALPVRITLEEAEADLIAYALKKGWERVEDAAEAVTKSQPNEGYLFRKAKEWYENTPEFEFTQNGKFGLRTIVQLQKALDVSCEEASELFDRVIDSKNEPKQTTLEKMGVSATTKSKGKNKDTMTVERTLTTIEAPCGEECERCCACQNDECFSRFANFGNAAECIRTDACSKECPRYTGAE